MLTIEVKSGKNYKVRRTVNNALTEESHHLRQGSAFDPGNIKTDNAITYYPIYLIDQLYND